MKAPLKRAGILGLFCVLVSPLQGAQNFPEENQRQWDRGCVDWPTSDNPLALPNPHVTIEKSQGYFRVYAQMRLRPESNESIQNLQAKVLDLLAHGDSYEKWVLPRINEKSDGGEYFVRVLGMKSQQVAYAKQYVLGGPYEFRLLFFKREGYSTLEFRRDDDVSFPDCSLFKDVTQKKLSRFVYRMTPRKDLLSMMLGELWVLPFAQELQLRFRLVVQPATLPYQLMPEALLRSQVQERARQVFENFVELRRLWALNKVAFPFSNKKLGN